MESSGPVSALFGSAARPETPMAAVFLCWFEPTVHLGIQRLPIPHVSQRVGLFGHPGRAGVAIDQDLYRVGKPHAVVVLPAARFTEAVEWDEADGRPVCSVAFDQPGSKGCSIHILDIEHRPNLVGKGDESIRGRIASVRELKD